MNEYFGEYFGAFFGGFSWSKPQLNFLEEPRGTYGNDPLWNLVEGPSEEYLRKIFRFSKKNL